MFSKDLQQYAREKYFLRLPLLGGSKNKVIKGMEGCSREEKILMQFLYGTMPLRDAGEYDFSVFLSFARHSLMLYQTMDWCRDIPEEMFLHDILFYRINTESIADCRRFFYDQLINRIQGMTAKQAALEINYWCAENGTYQSSDDRTISPLTFYLSGNGRCGEESTFAVTAFRSVGIPARQVYTPRWAHCDDNHAWVEVYVDGKWHFLGACEPEEVLDKGWFTHASSRAMLIHSRTFSDYGRGKKEEDLGSEEALFYYNETASYALSKKVEIFVLDEQKNPVEGVLVSIEILNMAEYSSCASLYTDKNGRVFLTLGLGSIHLFAEKDGYSAEETISVKDSSRAVLVLTGKEPKAKEIWEDVDIEAPFDYPMHPVKLTQEQKEKNWKRLQTANRLRRKRIQGYFQENSAAAYPDEREIFLAAGGNFQEIYRFLSKDNNPDRKALLHSLSIKDAKDIRADILEKHLYYASFFREEWERCRKLDCFVQYILCPRIYLEEITNYRENILDFFSEEERKNFAKNPEHIWTYIQNHVQYDPNLDYCAITSTPSGCLQSMWGNPLSQKILFVAICRTLGIPARINQVNLEAEILQDGEFIALTGKKHAKEKGNITLLAKPNQEWRYYQNWTIGQVKGGQISTLNYTGLSFSRGRIKLKLDPGRYRLITACRLPNGNQKASQYWFDLKENQEKLIEMRMRSVKVNDMLTANQLEDFELETLEGVKVFASSLLKGRANILVFLSVGTEPSEHVLNELLEYRESLRKLPARLFFILPNREALNHPTLQKAVKNIAQVIVVFGNFSMVIEPLARRMYTDPEKLPLLLVTKPGMTGIYGCSGYNVGSVDLTIKILQLNKENTKQTKKG